MKSRIRQARRYRIMRQLGLTPPIGSPFSPHDDQKNSFKRVFSEEDEVLLLNAFLSSAPISATTLFDRIGNSLGSEITRSQLIAKLQKLRQRYFKQVSRRTQLVNPHEREVFEISHKIWGDDLARRSSTGSSMALLSDKTKESKTVEKAENGSVKLDLEKSYSYLMEEASRLPGILKQGLQLLNPSELERLNELWRLQQIEEAKLLSKRGRLIEEKNKLILDAIVIG